MKKFKSSLIALVILLTSACSENETVVPEIANEANYKLTFFATWSSDTHPENFPSSPHFSSLIGATHNSNATFWEVGKFASKGVKDVAELGRVQEIKNEITISIEAGTSDKLLASAGISVSPGSREFTFGVSKDYSLVSIISMLAPSPDWFVGVNSLNLIENNSWLQMKEIPLYVYDAGTDSGDKYTSPNLPTSPYQVIMKLEAAPFLVNGSLKEIGKFVIEKVD